MKERQTPAGLLAVVLLLAAVPWQLAGCAKEPEDAVVLRVANWEEYLDEGGWEEEERIVLEDGRTVYGADAMISDFESWYQETYGKKVRVEYSTFGTNEDLYNQMTMGDVFDLACPSEYMMMKLLAEGKLVPFSEEFLDASREENDYARGVSPYIRRMLSGQRIAGEDLSRYAAGYMWGTVGFVYNPEEISRKEASDWNLLRNSAYYKRITTKDSVRDCYFAALGMLCQDEVSTDEFRARGDYQRELSRRLNDTDAATVKKAEALLTEMKENVYSFETDSGKADLVTGKVAANLQWSGDAVYSIAQAAEDGVSLCYAVPSACTNLWFDGWCLLKSGVGGDAEKRHAAEAFVNFLSQPQNVIRNMYYIGYTSAISGGEDDMIYQYVRRNYGSEEQGSVPYELGYFFSGVEGDGRYRLQAAPEMTEGILYAAYPPKEVIDRSVVMAYFSPEANKRIGRMWINVRCFSLP